MKMIRSPWMKITMILLMIYGFTAGCATRKVHTASQQEVQPPAPPAPVDIGRVDRTEEEGSPAKPEKTVTDVVEPGDLVSVHYTMRLEDGDVIFTTREDKARDKETPRADWFRAPPSFGPQSVLAGSDEGLKELSEALVGMHVGDIKTANLAPSKAFGAHDPKKVRIFPRIKTVPRKAMVEAPDYVNQMNAFPITGREVRFIPYFKSKVIKVTERYTVLEALAEDGEQIEADYGVTTLSVGDDEVKLELAPTVGAKFKVDDQEGRICKVGEDTFSVDFNHPAAGKPILMDMEVKAVEKAADFKDNELDWIQDHDAGYETAIQEFKPMVMVLYASWCGWSKKLMENTIKDPRIQKLWDDFVWVKVDSDQQPHYKEMYGQSGYPMVVLTDETGEIVTKIDGFRDPRTFLQELKKCLAAVYES